MSEKGNFRYDPLYRAIGVSEEVRFIEGKLKTLFDKLKGIGNLGIIPEVLEMARYPKYEHHQGTVYQVDCLLDCLHTIKTEYHLPLRLSALFLHLGHLPFSYSTERALLLASGLGSDDRSNKAKDYVTRRVENVLKQTDLNTQERQKHLEELLSLKNYRNLYRYFSCEIFFDQWKTIKSKYQLDDTHKTTIARNLIDFKNEGHKYLQLADKADFVQRDALYFGTVRLDISPKHLYIERSLGTPSGLVSIDEKKLLDSLLDYLRERFYDSSAIRCFSTLFEKIVASLILSGNFQMKWLEELEDAKFKRLITENVTPQGKPAYLPVNWTTKAKRLFAGEMKYSLIFRLLDVSFEKSNTIIDIEYKLLQKGKSIRGLLAYPFQKGVLLDIDHSRKPRYPAHPSCQQFSVSLFLRDSRAALIELLRVIEQLSHVCSLSHLQTVRESIGRYLSWTGSIRIDNSNVVEALCEAVRSIESEKNYAEGEFVVKFLHSISSIRTFEELWRDFENFFLWKSYILFSAEHPGEQHGGPAQDLSINRRFAEGLLCLPVRLLQYDETRRHLDVISAKILELIGLTSSNEKKGYFFEALWLIRKTCTRRGWFQFLLNGLVVVDPKKPASRGDIHEFDVIELVITGSSQAECWIYACSIAEDYTKENKEQLDKLAGHIHKMDPSLKVRTRYVIPEDRDGRLWQPKEEETGVGSWN